MTRFLLTLAVVLLILWMLRRLFTPRAKPPPSNPDVIEGRYTEVEKDSDRDRAP